MAGAVDPRSRKYCSSITAHTLLRSCVECAANWSVVAKATAKPTSETCAKAKLHSRDNLCRSKNVRLAGNTETAATIPAKWIPITGCPVEAAESQQRSASVLASLIGHLFFLQFLPFVAVIHRGVAEWQFEHIFSNSVDHRSARSCCCLVLEYKGSVVGEQPHATHARAA